MSKLNIDVYVLGPLETNVYIVSNTDTKECVIIDPAERSAFLSGRIEEGGYTLKAMLITHGHRDHITAVPALEKKYGLKRQMYEEEKEMDLIGFRWKVIYTPGHTADSCCYYIEDEKVIFSGDTLFYGTFGRTEPETEGLLQIKDSLKNKLFLLPDDVTVLPGHGEPTTIGWEKKDNAIFWT